MIDPGGAYRSIHTYGYNSNGYAPYTMTANDWQEWWRLQERHSLLLHPDAPLGAGLVLSTARLQSAPDRARFSGGGMGDPSSVGEVQLVAQTFRHLHEAGVSLPSAINAAALEKWTGNAPLIVLNLSDFSDAEIEALRRLIARGVRVAAFKGGGTLPSAAARLFGVTTNEKAAVVAPNNTLLVASSADQLNEANARTLAPILQRGLVLPLTFPAGTAGYGYVMRNRRFVVVEDWLEQGRVIDVRLRATKGAKTARACDANDHRPLVVRRGGADWVISVSLRPGDEHWFASKKKRCNDAAFAKPFGGGGVPARRVSGVTCRPACGCLAEDLCRARRAPPRFGGRPARSLPPPKPTPC